MPHSAFPFSRWLKLVRRTISSLRHPERHRTAVRDHARPHRYIDEMTRSELLAELAAEHNASVPGRAPILSNQELLVLLKFLRQRAWIGHQQTLATKRGSTGVQELRASPRATEQVPGRGCDAT